MNIHNHPITPRRGNEHVAQGIALGGRMVTNALRSTSGRLLPKGRKKGQKQKCGVVLLPLQGDGYALFVPRVLP